MPTFKERVLEVLRKSHGDGIATVPLTAIAEDISKLFTPNGIVVDDPKPQFMDSREMISYLSGLCHGANREWWLDINTGLPLDRNVGELLMLTVSELAEAMEGHRKGLMDDKLPSRSMIEVELADALIRIFDMAGGLGLDVAGAFVDKMYYNAHRVDHTAEHRKSEGGKKY